MSEEKKPTASDIMAAIDGLRGQVHALAVALESTAATLADHGAKLDAIRNAPTGMTPRTSSGNAPGAGTGSGMTVKFGRDKGKRLDEVADLTWYRGAIAKSCDDPEKGKWRDRNLDDLAEIDREIARRAGGTNPAQTTAGYSDAPPAEAPPEFGQPPDDDIPFVMCEGIR